MPLLALIEGVKDYHQTQQGAEAMRIELTRWGMELAIMGLIVRLVAGDVFLRVPMVGLLAWNQCGLSLDRWSDAKHEPVL
ncbi:hypothetical protein [Halomonas sp. SL1]|uniref:hypothetical protein n=1 Tax=Halomonas sp. SL1 TaxID=2137478 RepID=UPI0011B935F2|nr:hypothetical protein [Halomonas sp. SL1]